MIEFRRLGMVAFTQLFECGECSAVVTETQRHSDWHKSLLKFINQAQAKGNILVEGEEVEVDDLVLSLHNDVLFLGPVPLGVLRKVDYQIHHLYDQEKELSDETNLKT